MSWSAAQIQLNLRRAAERKRDAAAAGLGLAAEHVLQVSRTRVPIEEGTLERSGATHLDGDNLRAFVSYDTPYAVRQHEDLTLAHDAGRSAKYLESALTGERRQVRQIIAATIRDSD